MTTRSVPLGRIGERILDLAPLVVFVVLLGAMLAPWPRLLVAVALAAVVWLAALRWLPTALTAPAALLRSSWLLLAVLVLVAWAHWPAVSGDFVTDDYGCLQLWHSKSAGQLLQLGDVSEGIWGAPDDELRPVFALWYKALLDAFGVRPLPLHVANLILHLLTCVAVFGIARQWWGPPGNPAAVSAGLLFGLMPVHAEPVAWLIGGVDVLSTLFYLVVVLLFVRFRATRRRGAWLAAAAVCIPAMFTKETVVTLPATLLAFDLIVARPADWRPGQRTASLLRLAGVHAPFVLASAGFLVLRRLAFHTFAREGRVLERLPWFLSSLPTRLRWFLLPDPAGGAWQLAVSCFASGALLACLLWLWRHRHDHRRAQGWVACFGLAVPIVTHLPLIVTYLSPRHLYLPGAALALAAGAAIFPRRDQGPRVPALKPQAAPTGTLDPGSRVPALKPQHASTGTLDQDSPSQVSIVRATMLLLLVLVFVPALRERHQQWHSAEAISRAARLGIDAVTQRVPAGSLLVIAGIPDQLHSTLVWRFALPFALQPPFIDRDLDRSFVLIEAPELYCCPVEYWWKRRMPPLTRLLAGPPEERVDVRLAEWKDGAIHLRHGRPRRRLVRGLIENTLGHALAPTTTGSPDEARRVVDRLADLARRGLPRAESSPRGRARPASRPASER